MRDAKADLSTVYAISSNSRSHSAWDEGQECLSPRGAYNELYWKVFNCTLIQDNGQTSSISFSRSFHCTTANFCVQSTATNYADDEQWIFMETGCAD